MMYGTNEYTVWIDALAAIVRYRPTQRKRKPPPPAPAPAEKTTKNHYDVF